MRLDESKRPLTLRFRVSVETRLCKTMIDQFRIADKNESGSLDREEMTEVLLALYRGEKISRKACLIQEDVNVYMTQFDADGSGELEFLEFVNFATNPDVLKLKLTTKQRERVILLARAMSALMADNVASPITRREKYITNKKSIEEGMRKLVTLIERYQADANNTQSIESLLSSVIGTDLDVDIFEEKMKSILATEKHATFLDCLSLSYGTEELGLQVSPEAKADALSFVKQASEQVKIVTEPVFMTICSTSFNYIIFIFYIVAKNINCIEIIFYTMVKEVCSTGSFTVDVIPF